MAGMEPGKKGRRARRQSTEEFRAGAVRLVLNEGQTVTRVARDLDLTVSALRAWVARARADRSKGRSGGLTTVEREELARLRKENRELRMERDILENFRVPPTPSHLLDQKRTARLCWRALREPWPSASLCRREPVKKHGPGVAGVLDRGDAVRRSRLGK